MAICLAAMLPGLFAALEPAARAGSIGLLAGLLIAFGVASCNATSSAQLAARFPWSGATYVYAKRQLGDLWGFLAGWGFAVGKTVSAGALALTISRLLGLYDERLVAVLVLALVAGIASTSVHYTSRVSKVTAGTVITCFVVVTIAALTMPHAARPHPETTMGDLGFLRAAAFLFFAYTGYAQIATLGEEVINPRRTIPRAIPLALGAVLAIYVAVVGSSLLAVGPGALARDGGLGAVGRAGQGWVLVVLKVGALAGMSAVTLLQITGVSRTVYAMAADGHLPGVLADIHPTARVPRRAALAVAIMACVLVLTTEVTQAVGLASFCVLLYYALTNASALRLDDADLLWPRWRAATGFTGCVVLALMLPVSSVAAGLSLYGSGAVVWLFVRGRR